MNKAVKHPYAVPRKRQKVELLPDVTGEWSLGGYEYAGGRVGLGENIGVIRTWKFNRQHIANPNPDAILGALVLASVGWTTNMIKEKTKFSTNKVNNLIEGTRDALGIPSRLTLLPAMLKHRLFQMNSYGRPQRHFLATPYELTQLGLVASCVDLSVVSKASGILPDSLWVDFGRISKREGVDKTAGCFAAAFSTHQLGERTCVPLLHTGQETETVRPIVPVDVWNGLVERQNVGELTALFSRIEAQKAAPNE